MEPIRVAMLGFGGIAKSHKRAYEQFEKEGTPIRLVAICDIDEKQFTRVIETNLGAAHPYTLDGINLYTDLDEMIAKEDFDMVDICLPSYKHCEYAVKMLKAGKHVQCEKPMALSSADCDLMIKTAEECGKKLMIGQCLRFEPQYLFLKECIDDQRYGKLLNGNFDRLSALPLWGYHKWYQKTERSGGAILDLHIHDVDMMRFLFGEPKSVTCYSYDRTTRWQFVKSFFNYGGGALIEATGSWDEARGTKFRATYRVRFENASVYLEDGKITVFPDGEEPFEPEIPKQSRMAEEIRYLVRAIQEPDFVPTVNNAVSARNTVALVEKLRESADNGSKPVEI